ncbi:transglutaminase family protein, partial [Candidatus Omnitrophota bacterium]
DENGLLLKGDILGFKFIKQQSGELFRQFRERPLDDIIFSFSIPASGIEEKENLRSLKLRIKGLPSDFKQEELCFFNQDTVRTGDSLTVAIEKTAPQNTLDIPLGRDILDEFSIKETLMREESQKLHKVALSVIGDETNIVKIVERLHSWIDKNIEKTPTFSLFNSSDVLQMKQGDCTELSILLVGFLRSLGIPSYVNIGLVYQDQRFYYHAWPSAFIGEWIDTDPALSQLIADATHIKLLKGVENQTKLLQFLGGLSIEIVETEYE